MFLGQETPKMWCCDPWRTRTQSGTRLVPTVAEPPVLIRTRVISLILALIGRATLKPCG